MAQLVCQLGFMIIRGCNAENIGDKETSELRKEAKRMGKEWELKYGKKYMKEYKGK